MTCLLQSLSRERLPLVAMSRPHEHASRQVCLLLLEFETQTRWWMLQLSTLLMRPHCQRRLRHQSIKFGGARLGEMSGSSPYRKSTRIYQQVNSKLKIYKRHKARTFETLSKASKHLKSIGNPVRDPKGQHMYYPAKHTLISR